MPDDLYRRDILAWSQAQADRLRRMAAGEKVNDLDWANVIEEIESVGRSETQAVASFLLQALIHGLKLLAWPDHPASRKWRNEMAGLLDEARARFAPSMAQAIDLDRLQQRARRRVGELEMDRPAAPLPPAVALTLEELLAEDQRAESLVGRLAGR